MSDSFCFAVPVAWFGTQIKVTNLNCYLWIYLLTYLLTYILTYLLTPYSRVILEKLTGSAASREISRNLWNPKVYHLTHKCPPPVPILRKLHPVPKTPSRFLKVLLIIIFPSTSGSPQWSLPSGFPTRTLCTPPSYAPMPRPSHSSRFYRPYNIG